VQVHGLG